jgi:hypothetical protein
VSNVEGREEISTCRDRGCEDWNILLVSLSREATGDRRRSFGNEIDPGVENFAKRRQCGGQLRGNIPLCLVDCQR